METALEAVQVDLPQEHRRHPRKRQALYTSLYTPTGDLLSQQMDVTDLSSTGLGLSTPVDMSVGDTVRFKVSLAKGKQAKGIAQIRWVKHIGLVNLYGLEIIHVSPLDRYHLMTCIEPRNLVALRWLDLSLQYAFFVTLVLLCREVFDTNGLLRDVLADIAPLAAVILGVFASVFVYLKNRVSS